MNSIFGAFRAVAQLRLLILSPRSVFRRKGILVAALFLLLPSAWATAPAGSDEIPAGLDAASWSSICSQITQLRFEASRDGAALVFYNPGQRVQARLEDDGIQLTPPISGDEVQAPCAHFRTLSINGQPLPKVAPRAVGARGVCARGFDRMAGQ